MDDSKSAYMGKMHDLASAVRDDLAGAASDAPGTTECRLVVCYPPASAPDANGHEARTRGWAANFLADLEGADFAGDFDEDRRYPAPLYFVPKDTICPVELAGALGMHCDRDLFGGVAPHPFVATKAITHARETPDAPAPAGWSDEFGQRVRDVVLPGGTAFTRENALSLGERMLREGSVRAKDPDGIGGLGQTVIVDRHQLAAHVGGLDEAALRSSGLVLERNLQQPETLSVGQVRVGQMLISYFGVQSLTTNNKGQQVYGGSRLLVCRGGFEAVLLRAPTNAIRLAIVQVRKYHQAAFESFPGLFASRCNYDVVQGADDQGRWRSGVLEQSWRIGGASAAELLALRAFREDPALDAAR
ncbi:MAG TPA: DUF3182 family protein, partial [Burkholderiaceae bacterium]|nr:DUF3182 family protein [Burkholderiaceae bacterium]